MKSAIGTHDIAAGFVDPPHESQRVFRGVLEAFAHPGRIVTVVDAPQPPRGLYRATAAFLLTLADRDTPLWLAPEFDTPEVGDFIRFHTGAPIVGGRAEAAFAVQAHDQLLLFDTFSIGTDTYPDRSATLVVEVPALGAGPARTWRGPGIDGQASVAVAGLDHVFWNDWAANHSLFPCGVDVVFAAGSQLLALPRGITVEA
ncbi:MAG: phosphonate C-P lyase system protein PhnH [Reyranella sp.]|nr:phosphonate C-P lyase system protein PhnH [Reyranella sp.]